MPRKSRNQIKTSIFHIMTQGINREYIFNCDEYMKKYLEFINKANEEIDIDIIAYCIMTNHAHFLIKCNDVNKITKFMHKINTSYAIYYNRVENRVGYVFRDRYKIQEIMDIKHLYACVDYIHNNPVKAKICDSAEKYKYSSFYEIYKGNRENLYTKIARLVNQQEIESNSYNLSNENEYEIVFIEESQNKEELCKEMLNEYINNKKITRDELISNKENLIELAMKLKFLYNISYRVMEKEIGISRETIRNLVNKNQNEKFKNVKF